MPSARFPAPSPHASRVTLASRARRAALLLALALIAGCPSQASDAVVVHPGEGEPVRIAVELATTPDSRQLGLMYRGSLAPRAGMLFIFPARAEQSFWMRNTKIPLDILYIADDGRIVRIHERTVPFSEVGLPSGEPVRFVLEVPGGFSGEHGVRAGDRVDLGSLATHPVR